MALDAIEELCYEMSLHKLEALDEYAIFVVTNRGELKQKVRLGCLHKLIINYENVFFLQMKVIKSFVLLKVKMSAH